MAFISRPPHRWLGVELNAECSGSWQSYIRNVDLQVDCDVVLTCPYEHIEGTRTYLSASVCACTNSATHWELADRLKLVWHLFRAAYKLYIAHERDDIVPIATCEIDLTSWMTIDRSYLHAVGTKPPDYLYGEPFLFPCEAPSCSNDTVINATILGLRDVLARRALLFYGEALSPSGELVTDRLAKVVEVIEQGESKDFVKRHLPSHKLFGKTVNNYGCCGPSARHAVDRAVAGRSLSPSELEGSAAFLLGRFLRLRGHQLNIPVQAIMSP